MYSRHLGSSIRASLKDTPIALLCGARQSGKTTLARTLFPDSAAYFTLDDASTLEAATLDPRGFLERLDGPAILDEVQKAPALLPALKVLVDRERRPGRFLLTGSADVLLLPKVSESLAGRMEVFTLHPLSQGEIVGVREGFLGRLLGGKPWAPPTRRLGPDEWADTLVRGGFPEAVSRTGVRREAWFDAYVSALLQKDVREISNIDGLALGPRLLSLLAGRGAGLLNMADVARGAGLTNTSAQRYLALLEAVFLIRRVPAWASNAAKRFTKAPKLLLPDGGLMARLLRMDAGRVLQDPSFSGHLLENFVGAELLKQASWHPDRPLLSHYRTSAGAEVDFVLEGAGGAVVGIEVKSASTARSADFSGLRSLAEDAGKRWAGGVLLHRGGEILPFGPRLWALPLECLWGA